MEAIRHVDKGYDSNDIREDLKWHEKKSVIPHAQPVKHLLGMAKNFTKQKIELNGILDS